MKAAFSAPLGAEVEGPIRAEVVVVGGGAAGAAAALAARDSGKEVALIRRAYGATALGSGTLDLAPDPLAAPTHPLGARAPLAENLAALARRLPTHPYATLSGALRTLPEALAFFEAELGNILSFAAPTEGNVLLLTQLGALKATAGALRSQQPGDLAATSGKVALVGFAGHPEWDPGRLAHYATQAASDTGLATSFHPIASTFLGQDGGRLRPHEIAAQIEAAPGDFVDSIQRWVRDDFRLFLFPPVLGREDALPLLAALQGALGAPCAELPALHLSLPGLRLQRALDRRLVERGVQLYFGEVHAAERGVVESLRVRRARPELPGSRAGEAPSWEVRAEAVVLATGRFLGGGVVHLQRLTEPIFDLPIWVDGRVDLGTWPGLLSRHEVRDPQPLFAAGVRTDERLHPLNSAGEVVSRRLYACGDLLAGNDPARDGAGVGLALFTGYLAGRWAAMGEGI